MNDDIGLMHRGDLIDAMNRQSRAIEKNSDTTAKTVDKAETIATTTVANAHAAMLDVANHVLIGEGIVLGGAILLWHGCAWLRAKLA